MKDKFEVGERVKIANRDAIAREYRGQTAEIVASWARKGWVGSEKAYVVQLDLPYINPVFSENVCRIVSIHEYYLEKLTNNVDSVTPTPKISVPE